METNQSNGIVPFHKLNLPNSSVHNSIGMSPFSVVYRKTPRHALDLAKLPRISGSGIAAEQMVEQVRSIQEEVKV